MEALKVCPTIGVCGLDCGLCPRYYTVGPSRCPGCGGPDFLAKHPSCSFITCCVKRKGLEVCGQCPEFPCARFRSEEDYRSRGLSSSYPPERNVLSNLRYVKERGIGAFLRQQEKRMDFFRIMIRGYDDGRSRSFFCRAAGLLDSKTMRAALGKADRSPQAAGGPKGKRTERAKVLKRILAEAALGLGVEPAKTHR